MDVESVPTYVGIALVFIITTLAMTAKPIPTVLGIYYTVFLDALVITITDTVFKGEWGLGLGLMFGSWFGIVMNGANPVQALIGPFTWLLGPHIIVLAPWLF